MARSETIPQKIEEILYAAGVKNSGDVADAILSAIVEHSLSEGVETLARKKAIDFLDNLDIQTLKSVEECGENKTALAFKRGAVVTVDMHVTEVKNYLWSHNPKTITTESDKKYSATVRYTVNNIKQLNAVSFDSTEIVRKNGTIHFVPINMFMLDSILYYENDKKKVLDKADKV